MTHITHEAILEARIDRITDRCESWAVRSNHHLAFGSELEAAVRNAVLFKHMTRDQLDDYLIAAIDRAHVLADQLCPLPVEVDVLEGNARTGLAA